MKYFKASVLSVILHVVVIGGLLFYTAIRGCLFKKQKVELVEFTIAVDPVEEEPPPAPKEPEPKPAPTLEQVRANIVDALHFHIEGMMEDGEEVPMEFSGEWTPEFVLTTRAQLKYTDNYISRKALARETGIAEQQLSHYANGQRHPRPAMQARITAGIRAIAERLYLVL